MQREIAKRREADGYHVDLQKHQLVPLDAAKSTSETDKREPKHASAEAKAYPSDTHYSQPEHLRPAVPGDHLRAVVHSPPEVHHEQQKQPDTGKRPTLHATPTSLGVTGKIGKLGDELTPYEYSQSHPKEEPKPAPKEVKEPAHEMSFS